MNGLMIPRETIAWAAALSIGFPLAMLVLNEIILKLRRRHWPIVATLRIVRNMIMPTLAILLLLTEVGGLSTLSGRSSEVAITATDDLEVMVLDAHAVQKWLDRSPRLVSELGTVMDVRRRATGAARKMAAAR